MIEIDTREVEKIAQKHNLRFVALFGSQAKGKVHAKSDVDIAVSFDSHFSEENFKKQLEITRMFCDLLQRDDVEVVDVERISPTLMRSIAEEGKLLYERESGLFTTWKVLAHNVWFDSFRFREARDTSLLNWAKNYQLTK